MKRANEISKPVSPSPYLQTSGAPPEQFRAWKQGVPPLQEQCRRIIQHKGGAAAYGAVLEYPMPDSFRRADAILLIAGNVLVIELKGDGTTDPAYIEQVADYARRLYWYHSDWVNRRFGCGQLWSHMDCRRVKPAADGTR